MEETLLTQTEIEQILKESKNPIYQQPDRLFLGQHHTAIYRVSKTGVILIRGNKHTGLIHINERHNEFQLKPKWNTIINKKGEEIKRLDSPGLFQFASIPVVDYILIAEAIFTEDNLSEKGNNQPDLFDVYEGHYVKNGTQNKYKLVMYKGTGIINTLYPIDVERKKPIIHLYRGGASGSFSTMTEEAKVVIPYSDENVVRFKLILVSNNVTMIEDLIIEENDTQGNLIRAHYGGQRKLISAIKMPQYLKALDLADFTFCEKQIGKIMNGQSLGST